MQGTKRLLFLLLSLISTAVSAQFYAGTHQEFGKNRVQYREFNWLCYPTEQIEVYYYQGGEELAAYTLEHALAELKNLEGLLDYALQDQIQIIIYNKQSEWRQSNIGLTGDDQFNIGGTTRIIGSKLFIYYEGSHSQLEDQVRAGMARVLINQMMYGGDWKEVLKNSTLLTIPNWYLEGLVAYITNPNDPIKLAYMKDGIQSGRFDRFNRLNEADAVYAGYGLWKYIAEIYGDNVIPNVLYMTRISRNIENGFLFVLGTSVTTLTGDYLRYYSQRFEEQDRKRPLPELKRLYSDKQMEQLEKIQNLPEEKRLKALQDWNKKFEKSLGALPVKAKKKYTYDQFHLSPDGKHAVFATDEMGQYKVWLYNIPEGKLKRVYKREYRLQRITDKSFPNLCWHPSGKLFSFVTERKGRVFMNTYNLEDKKTIERELFRIEKVIDLAYSDDGKKMIFSGVNQGQTDLYIYYVIGNKQDKLLDDKYDDLEPRFIRNSEAVIFSSNRPDDTLRTVVPEGLISNTYDVFVIDINSRKLEQITQTPNANERQPHSYGTEAYTYLSDESGVFNRYKARIDSAISRIDTTIHYRYYTVAEQLSHYSTSVLEYDYQPAEKRYSMTFQKDGRMQLWWGKSTDDKQVRFTQLPSDPNAKPGEDSEMQIMEPEPEWKPEIDIRDYTFESEGRDYEYEKESVRLDITEETEGSGAGTGSGSGKGTGAGTAKSGGGGDFTVPKSTNYRVNFSTDYVLLQVDNSFTNRFYQPFSAPNSMNPGISGLIKLGVSDLFEDYKIIGGFRLAGNLDNNDYGIRFEDLSRRLDRVYQFQRQSLRRIEGFSILQYHTHTFEYQLKWPLNELASIRGSLIYRNDRKVFLSTDLPNLRQPNVNDHNVGVKMEYVFDNTLSKGLNLYNGTRYKVFAEYYQAPTVEQSDLTVLGFDVRHYQRIHRDLIYAFRAAGSYSFGSRKLIYYLGGVDNWLFQRVDDATEIPRDEGYAYQALAAPMRGFFLNSRNGDNFAIISNEIRWPIFKYLLNSPIKSDFVENFQVIGFTDVGSAWTGTHPYSEDNRFNTQVYLGNPVTVTIENNREPIVYGYGFGLRSRVLGYFVRADWSWGVDDGIRLPRVFYLSLNLDF